MSSRRRSSISGAAPRASIRAVRDRPSYLLTFVHRRAVDLVRREQARPQRGGDVDDIADRAGTRRHPGLARGQRAGRERAPCARRSPPPQRQVLELAYFNGLSQSEIAERLGSPSVR